MKPFLYLLTFGLLFISCGSNDDVLSNPDDVSNNPSDENLLTESLVALGIQYGPES